MIPSPWMKLRPEPWMPSAAAMARPMLGFSLTMRRIGVAMDYHSMSKV